MGRFLMYVVPLVVVLYALIDCILIPGSLARTLPKWLWLVVIVVVPVLGAVAWLVGGRPRREPSASPGAGLRRMVPRRSAPVAPDDDPAFLRKLGDDEWTRRMRDRRQGTTPDTDERPPDVP